MVLAEKQSAILRAEAMKEATIKEAEGQAEAIHSAKGQCSGIQFLNGAAPKMQ